MSSPPSSTEPNRPGLPCGRDSLAWTLSSGNRWVLAVISVLVACGFIVLVSGQFMTSPFFDRSVQVGMIAVCFGVIAAVWPVQLGLPVVPKHPGRVRIIRLVNATIFGVGVAGIAAVGYVTQSPDLDSYAPAWSAALLSAALTLPVAMWRPALLWAPGFAVLSASLFAPDGYLSLLEVVMMNIPIPALVVALVAGVGAYLTLGSTTEHSISNDDD